MTIRAFAVAAGALIASLTPSHAQQKMCAPYDRAMEIHKKAGQVETSLGVVNGGLAVILLTSPGGETWAIVTVDLQGNACLIGEGTNWMQGEIQRKSVEGEMPS